MDFSPVIYSPLVSQYLKSVKDNLHLASTQLHQDFRSVQHRYQNPSWLRSSLQELRDNNNIIITEADKNMGIVIMDKDKYISEGNRQLLCPVTYRKISAVSADLFSSLYEKLIQILKGFHNYEYKTVFNKFKLTQIAEYMLQLRKSHCDSGINYQPSPARFYLLMKMHKSPVVGRPIVSTINSFTYHTSVYVDSELKCLLPFINSYIESSQQLVYELEKKSFEAFPDCVICCADIESLYPNIPLHEGLNFVYKAITDLALRLPGNAKLRNDKHVRFIMQLMQWVLTNNYFKFGDDWFLQLQGTAMGTPLAVPFACLFVSQLETWVWNQPSVCSNLPLYYKRYIDDIFYIAKCKEDAEAFFTVFDHRFPTIRCGSRTIDTQSGIFLDVEIFKGSRFASSQRFDLRTYQKIQNRYLYLAPNSFHRRAVFKGTILSELNRYRITCTSDDDFDSMRSIFYHRLLARGYNPDYLNSIFPCHLTRTELLDQLTKRFSFPLTPKTSTIPLLFKVMNTYETSQIPFSKFTRPSEQLHQDLLLSNYKDIVRQPVLTCFSNASTSYSYIGSARKHLHHKNK